MCKRCGRNWQGKSECHCAGCCNHFRSEAAFRKHRAGKVEERRCMTVEEMLQNLVWVPEKK